MRVVWSRASGVVWSRGFRVEWSRGSGVVWSWGSRVLWSRGSRVVWSRGSRVVWSRGSGREDRKFTLALFIHLARAYLDFKDFPSLSNPMVKKKFECPMGGYS